MGSVAEELERLKALKDQGVLTEAEFDQQKARLLAGPTSPASAPVQVQAPAAKRSGIGCAGAIVLVLAILFIMSAVGKDDRDKEEAQRASMPALSVTATELANAYKANEAAAQQQYGAQPLLVTGVVDGVNLDMTNKPYVKLETGDQFNVAQARLTDVDQPRASGLVKGDQITLRCGSVSEILGSPMLAECSIQ